METYEELGFAKLDFSRAGRTGFGETVYCPGKTPEQLLRIWQAFRDASEPALGTRCSVAQAEFLKANGFDVAFDPVSGIVSSSWGKSPKRLGTVAVCTGGTADVPVAEEAARTAEFRGAEVLRIYDIGVAGIHRLFAKLPEIRKAEVVVAVAGMEGALGSVLAGLVDAPVVAVPTSAGYGTNLQGIAPLLSMLNSCAEGMAVVNVDNGFGAASLACRILNKRLSK